MLIEKLTEMFVDNEKKQLGNDNEKPQFLEFGKYYNSEGRMSSEEDFCIAEWYPTEKDLNGE